jgi:phage-related minor tail protein
MADQLASLVVAIAADANKYMQTLDQTQGKTKSWAGKIGGVATKAVGGLLVGGAVAAAGAVAAIGGAALNVSRETEQATANIAAQLGMTTEAAERFGAVAQRVYGDNFAGSVVDAGQTVAQAFQVMGDIGDKNLQRVTEAAYALQDSFGADTSESIDAAQTLMENFGISSDKAFDLIAKGFQSGLNRADDFTDTIGEYSTQFASGGASAEQFFNQLESGLAGGMLGTDKAADAFKEFRVRIQDGSKATAESLGMLGLDSETMAAQMADGSLTAAAAFGQVIGALQGTDDANVRMQAGVGLLGTQFEDLGNSALSLSLVGDQFADIEGAADSLNAKYQNFGDLWGAIWRKTAVAVSPATDKLLEMANDAMPYVEQAFAWMEEHIPPIIEGVSGAIEKGVQFIKGLFEGPLSDGIGSGVGAFQVVKDWIEKNMPLIRKTVETVLGALAAFWDAHGEKIMSVVRNFMQIVQTIFDIYLYNALDLVKVIMQLITGDFEGAGETIKAAMRRTFEGILSIVGLWADSIRTLLANIDWGAMGRAIIQGIANGMMGAGGLILDALTGAGEGILGGISALVSGGGGRIAEPRGATAVAGVGTTNNVGGMTFNIQGNDRMAARDGVLDALRSAGLA